MHRPPFNTRPILSDGGVYDNLGLEPVLKNFRTVLASDGGSPFRVDPTPSRCWPFQVKRVLDCIDNQVRALRRRDLIECFKTRQRTGCYWGIGTPMQEYAQKCGLEMTSEVTTRLAQIPTRLARMDGRLQEQLINWGYAACAASLATHFQEGSAVSWPYPHAIS